MALSGTISESMTAQELVDTACEILGYTPPGESTSAEAADLGLKHLNWMLKTWQMSGVCDGWRREDIEIPWPAATASATLDVNYLDLVNVRLKDADDIETVLTQYSAQEYAELPDKAAAGDPTAYNLRKVRTTLTLSLWPVPEAATTIVADGSRVFYDVTALTQDVDIPQEWTEAAFYALAARLALPLGIVTSDPNRVSEIKERAGALYTQAKGFDEETGSVFLGVGC